MTIELHDNVQENIKMDSDNATGSITAENSTDTTSNPNNSNTADNPDPNQNITPTPASSSIDDTSIFDESFPPLSSQPDIMSITPKQALFYLHQSLTSLIKLHENLLLNRRDSPVVIDDDGDNIMDSGSEVGDATTTDGTTPLNTGNVPPPSSSSNFQNFRRRSHRYSDISPFSMAARRTSSGGAHSHLGPIRSGEEDDYEIFSPSSPGSLNSSELRSNSNPTNPSNFRSTDLRRQKKSTSLLAEAAEVASLVLQGGNTLQEEYTRLKKSMNWSINPDSSTPSSIPSSPLGSPVSLRQSPSAGSVSSIQEQKLAIARRFWSKTAPQITVQKYLQRLYKYCPSSTSVYLSAGLYIYRLCIILQTIPLTDLSVHRLVLAAIRIACKSIEDINHGQARFAMAAGVSTSDLYRLEIALLFLLDFNIKVDYDSLQRALEVWTEVEIQARHVLERPVLSSPIVG